MCAVEEHPEQQLSFVVNCESQAPVLGNSGGFMTTVQGRRECQCGKSGGTGGGQGRRQRWWEGRSQAGQARTSTAAMPWLLERVTWGFRGNQLYLGAVWNEHEERREEQV
ncbi:hypothetical protein C8J57DRAFT_1256994 [Mycena rebaudengoi]|nr:hypothetical protein C8J57DRAFT_1256994 [Mycena rebaudengoi]